MSDSRFEAIREVIADDDLESAAEQLLTMGRGVGGALADEAVLLMGRLRGWERRARSGVEQDRLLAERAQLRSAMLAFSTELVRRMRKPPAYVDRIDIGDCTETYEKEFGQAKLRHIAWLRTGLAAGRAVARVLAPGWKGTGFLLHGGWLVTNWHVLPTSDIASRSEVEFNFEEDLDGRMLASERYHLDRTTHRADERLDCACVKVIERAEAPLTTWGHLELERHLAPVVGDHVAIIQHPDGGPKKIAMGDNQIVNLYEHRLQYMTDTMPGSSGAPVFDDRWRVVAVHHAGGNLKRTARGHRIYANEGMLARDVSAVLFP